MNLLSILHIIIILIILFTPFIFSSCKSLLIYLIIAILIILQWKVNNNMCLLTNLEKYFYPEEYKNVNDNNGFIAKYLKKININLDFFNHENIVEIILLIIILFTIIKVYWKIY